MFLCGVVLWWPTWCGAMHGTASSLWTTNRSWAPGSGRRTGCFFCTPFQCCGSGMFIPDPGSWFLPIPDPGSRIPDLGSRIQKQQWKTGVKKNMLPFLFWSHKFHKIELFYVWNVEEKNLVQFSKNYRTFYGFTQKIVTKLSKIWVWDPRSGIRKNLFQIPDPGVKKAPDPGSRSATLPLFYRIREHCEANIRGEG